MHVDVNGAMGYGLYMMNDALKPAATNLLAHEQTRQVYESSLTKFEVYGEINGVRYNITVNKNSGKDSARVAWNVDKGRGWRAKGWACTHGTVAEAIAFAESKLATLRDWASRQDVKPEPRPIPWLSRADFGHY